MNHSLHLCHKQVWMQAQGFIIQNMHRPAIIIQTFSLNLKGIDNKNYIDLGDL